MDRRTLITRGVGAVAVLAVIVAFLTFKVRVAIAGGKYILFLALIVGVVWMASRALKR